MQHYEHLLRKLCDVDRQSVQRALGGLALEGNEQPTDVLRRALRTLGMRLVQQPNDLPALALAGTFLAEADQTFWVVQRLRKYRFEARSPVHGHSVVRGRLSELKQLLCPQSPKSVTLATVERLLPLQSMAQTTVQAAPLRRLLAWSALEQRDLWLIFFFAVGLGVFSLAAPVAVQALFTTVSFGVVLQPVFILGFILLLALSLLAALRVLQTVAVEFISRRFFVRSVWDFGRRLTQAPAQAFAGKVREDLANRLFDVAIIEKAFVSLAFDGIGACLQILAGLTLLAIYHPLLLVLDIFIVAILAVLLFGFGAKATQTALKESTYKHAIAVELKNMAAAHHVFRSSQGEKLAEHRLGELADHWQGARSAHFRAYMRQVLGTLGLQVVASTALLVLGGMLVIERQLSLGQLVAAELVMALTVDAMAKLAKIYPKAYDMLASLEKVGHVVDVQLGSEGHIELSNDAHAHPLKVTGQGCHLEVAAGERCVVSNTDLQKALRQIVRYPHSISQVKTHIADIDVRQIAASCFHQQVNWLHPSGLFAGSIRDNLTLGEGLVQETKLLEILRQVGLAGAVERFPKGLEVTIGRDLEELEPLEIAQILVARVLLQRPKVIVVDGLFERLKAPERRQLLQLLLAECPATLIFIAHEDELTSINADCRRVEVA